MASEPPEDAIDNFVSFTSTTREQAIGFLKAHSLDSQRAINAYFEDPTGPHPKVIETPKDLTLGKSPDKGMDIDRPLLQQTPGFYNDNSGTPIGFGQQDHTPSVPPTAPPSRPPSRTNMIDATQPPGYDNATAQPAQRNIGELRHTSEDWWNWWVDKVPRADTHPSYGEGKSVSGNNMSLAQREEQDLQQAVAMSLNQGMGQQETGVTNKQAQSGSTTRDDYDSGAWAMTLFNATSQEVMTGPDPEDRKRVMDQPAFIRPTNNNLYLGGLLTILHGIPLAREAFMLRKKVLFDYGQDSQWWNGQPINLPKIVTVHDGHSADNDWDDIIYETQRLMAFLDSTERAYGSSDALANLKALNDGSSDSEEVISRFLESWHRAALRADPENPLSTIFMSHAYKRTPFDGMEGDEPIEKDMFVFGPQVEQEHGQTLYDVLDTAMWSDQPGQELDDVWLEHVGEILVMKLDSFENSKSLNVEAPVVFYPDRYLSSCREIALDFRARRLEVMAEIQDLEKQISTWTWPRKPCGNLTVKELFEQTAEAVPVVMRGHVARNDPSWTTERKEKLVRDLKYRAGKVQSKLDGLETKKQEVLEKMRSYSKFLTEPSDSPNSPPTHKYTLRGVCTQPHVTYILKRNETTSSGDAMKVDEGSNGQEQWWRISYSAEDGQTRQAEKPGSKGKQPASRNGDFMGYTVRRVEESEALDAAREEWRTVLLVYASESAMGAKAGPAPMQLQGFVRKDNAEFTTECEQSTANAGDTHMSDSSGKDNSMSTQYPSSQERDRDRNVNVFDYEVSDFDSERGSGKEMQEKSQTSLLSASKNKASREATVSRALDDDSVWNSGDEDQEMVDHVEDAKS
ncbi:hypothetical protein N7532_006477 [Penicillium argentinense]|uniref:Ubiquitin interaction motif protein n=1 Tax=Penicillium argentinense TaxID=1131581 RepID=A0A9W9FG20_9EURO|nr:uncharacterized protein N7532_006477 [Penicillium argentinense]KAJ5099476.1 hypothetical protein N7532_006477 [Penicillium argentinense]